MKTLISFLFLVFSSTLMAQGLEVGLKAGANSTGYSVLAAPAALLDPGQPLSYDQSTSIYFGVYSSIALGNWSVQPELLYIPRKTTLNYSNRSVEQENKFLDIPVIFEKRLFGSFNFQIGPQVGFLLSAKAGDVNSIDDFKKVDLSAVTGLGWDSPIGLNASLRFMYSLINVNSPRTLGGLHGNVRYRSLQFAIGYRLFKRGN